MTRDYELCHLLVGDGFNAIGPVAGEAFPHLFEKTAGEPARVLRVLLMGTLVEFRTVLRTGSGRTLLAGPVRRHPLSAPDKEIIGRVRNLSGFLKHLPACPVCAAPMLGWSPDPAPRVFRCTEHPGCAGERPYVPSKEDREQYRTLLRRALSAEGAVPRRAGYLAAAALAQACGMGPEAAEAALLLSRAAV